MRRLCLFSLGLVSGDIFLHMPRGGNDRLNENGTGRANGNRLWDSQNNNQGGYNVGDRDAFPAVTMDEQFSEIIFQSGSVGKSYWNIEWWDQHGCGVKRNAHDINHIDCQVILQYKCHDVNDGNEFRNGFITNTPKYNGRGNIDKETFEEKVERKAIVMEHNNESGNETGFHETWEYYDACAHRKRNEGLFMADQEAKTDWATCTRQNKNSGRRGYECAEERDYYPYWHPSEWTDIAILTSEPSKCAYYEAESAKAKFECVEYYSTSGQRKHYSMANNEKSCVEEKKGQWIGFYEFMERIPLSVAYDKESCESQYTALRYGVPLNQIKWGYPHLHGVGRHEKPLEQCLIVAPPLVCRPAPVNRENHLGNDALTGGINSFKWTLPYYPMMTEPKECVVRARYNISSDDYTEPVLDGANVVPFFEPAFLTKNPTVEIVPGLELKLALNTAQIARTFQDRSHVFKLYPRQMGAIWDHEKVENLQVKGKRGNIVQTAPNMEYEFSPSHLEIDAGTLVHIQWAGANSGRKNNAGQGKDNTDRHNILQVDGIGNWNLPRGTLHFTNRTVQATNTTNYLTSDFVEWVWTASKENTIVMENLNNLRIQLASSGYYECVDESCAASVGKLKKLQEELDNAPASWNGNVIRFIASDTSFQFMATRNNNFSNRAQKGIIVVH